MRFFKTPALFRFLFPQYVWRKPVKEKVIYLTFDDGPVPEITEFVLKQLAMYQVRATFFCVGENLGRYPEIAQQIVKQGHRLANHTFNHLRGWETDTDTYLQNIALCQQQLDKFQPHQTPKLFRPPHGRIRRGQFQKIKSEYHVIMWEVLTYDFDATLSPEVCLQQTIKQTTAGSVVVLHDSVKARRNMEYVLPRFLSHFANLGYRFESL